MHIIKKQQYWTYIMNLPTTNDKFKQSVTQDPSGQRVQTRVPEVTIQDKMLSGRCGV